MRYSIYLLLGLCCGLCSAGDWVITEQAAPAEQGKPYWIMFTAKWCSPCQRWKKNEKPIMEKAGYAVTLIDIDHDPQADKWKKKYGVETVPTFFLLNRQTRETMIGPVVGAKSAVLMIRDINRWGVWPRKTSSIAITTMPAKLSCSEIRALVRSRYTPGRRLNSDVSPQSQVWIHLTDGSGGTHNFTSDQVSCLSLWEALALHDDAHGARTIRP